MVRVLLTLAFSLTLLGAAEAQPREEKVRNDRKKVAAEGFWIYNDFAKGVPDCFASATPLAKSL